MVLPEDFIHKMDSLLGANEAEPFFASFEKERAWGLRANPLKISPQDLAQLSEFHLKPIPFCPTGYYFHPSDHPGRHPFHQAGLYYIQEPSAMFVAESLGARPGEKVLDLCAAPGGKSTQIAGAMANTGLLVSNEIFPKRARILSENIERMGIRNALVTNETPERLADYFPGYFDKILVDAPCSGEGMFRKDPDAASYWSSDHVNECAALQAQILDKAYQMLRIGGILVYSTCTFSPEENEQVIDKFLSVHPDLSLLPLEKSNNIADGRPEWALTKNSELKKAARLWPHRLTGEGHFVAKLQKHGESLSSRQRKSVTAKAPFLADYREFEQAALTNSLQGSFYLSGNQLYLLPEDCPEFRSLHVIRAGVHLGELKKNRFEPNHALALAFPASQFHSLIELEIANGSCAQYLRGETLPVPDSRKGWTIVTISGYPLGWGKASAAILKNFYPKGLRRRANSHPE
ncbi:MAG: RsmF rRNA methyltransferase first C-terminal domain-containing protein [Sporolactobacillus sp.]